MRINPVKLLSPPRVIKREFHDQKHSTFRRIPILSFFLFQVQFARGGIIASVHTLRKNQFGVQIILITPYGMSRPHFPARILNFRTKVTMKTLHKYAEVSCPVSAPFQYRFLCSSNPYQQIFSKTTNSLSFASNYVSVFKIERLCVNLTHCFILARLFDGSADHFFHKLRQN